MHTLTTRNSRQAIAGHSRHQVLALLVHKLPESVEAGLSENRKRAREEAYSPASVEQKGQASPHQTSPLEIGAKRPTQTIRRSRNTRLTNQVDTTAIKAQIDWRHHRWERCAPGRESSKILLGGHQISLGQKVRFENL